MYLWVWSTDEGSCLASHSKASDPLVMEGRQSLSCREGETGREGERGETLTRRSRGTRIKDHTH